jgi:hypothetical protein
MVRLRARLASGLHDHDCILYTLFPESNSWRQEQMNECKPGFCTIGFFCQLKPVPIIEFVHGVLSVRESFAWASHQTDPIFCGLVERISRQLCGRESG